MQKRLCGREQEYGVTFDPMPRRCFEDREFFEKWRADKIKLVLEEIPRAALAIRPVDDYDLWLSNGSRIYNDMGVLLEVASAEYSAGSFDGVAQEKSSEIILNKAAKLAAKAIGLRHISFYKNNVGPAEDEWGGVREVSYGSHHNYSYERKRRMEVLQLMKNFIPAMLPLSGSGHILELNQGKFIYCLSQRSKHIKCVIGSDTTKNRSIVDLRGDSNNDSLMDESTGLNRLHIISRDATRCELQTWLVDTITHLVLRLAEEGWRLPFRFTLKNPLLELHRLNFSTDLVYKPQLQSGIMSVIDYHRIFLTAARQLKFLSLQEKRCLNEWERILEILKAKAFGKLIGEIDWVTKMYLLKNQMNLHKFNLNDPRTFLINMEYHNISTMPNRSLFARLDEKGYIKHLINNEEIKKAIIVSPETRARSRGEFIKRCLKDVKLYSRVKSFNWDKAETEVGDFYFGKKDDPFSASSFDAENYY